MNEFGEGQTFQPGANVADRAASVASQTIDSAQAATNAGFDRLAEGVDKARDAASPLIEDLSGQAAKLARDGVESVKARSAQLRDQLGLLSDRSAERIKEEPLTSVLVAVGVGVIVGMYLNRPRYPAY